MPNLTLSISETTKKRMDRHPHVKWSSAVRAIIESKLNDFERAEKLSLKSRVSEKDVEFIMKKVNMAAAKRARELLESNS